MACINSVSQVAPQILSSSFGDLIARGKAWQDPLSGKS